MNTDFNGPVPMLCENCGHREICSKKAVLELVRHQLDEINCCENSKGILFLRDCGWVRAYLKCRHFIRDGEDC